MARVWGWVLVVPLLAGGCTAVGQTAPGQWVGRPAGGWAHVLQGDFDGDGQGDRVLGEPTTIANAYRHLVVRAGTGNALLETARESFYYLVMAAPAPLPILITGSPSGNWLRVEGFVYRPESGMMARLQWDGRDYVPGRRVREDPASGEVGVATEWGEVWYRFEDGAFSGRE